MRHIGENRRPLPHLGERVRTFLEPLGLSEGELAIRANIDLRTARSAKEGSCGIPTFEALSKVFGWEFIEAVMTPVVGADPLTAREAQLEKHMAEAAALNARLERDRSLRARLRAAGAGDRAAAGVPISPMGGLLHPVAYSPSEGA